MLWAPTLRTSQPQCLVPRAEPRSEEDHAVAVLDLDEPLHWLLPAVKSVQQQQHRMQRAQ
eukprot:6047886-Alexandrium_andersonii.AAC.1